MAHCEKHITEQGLWDEVEKDVNTEDWELFDIVHAVLPTRLPLEQFYEQFAGLWQHALDVRFEHSGKLKCYLGMLAAMATGKVSRGAFRKGMRLGLSNVRRLAGDAGGRLEIASTPGEGTTVTILFPAAEADA